jgi:hypothetical protein
MSNTQTKPTKPTAAPHVAAFNSFVRMPIDEINNLTSQQLATTVEAGKKSPGDDKLRAAILKQKEKYRLLNLATAEAKEKSKLTVSNNVVIDADVSSVIPPDNSTLDTKVEKTLNWYDDSIIPDVVVKPNVEEVVKPVEKTKLTKEKKPFKKPEPLDISKADLIQLAHEKKRIAEKIKRLQDYDLVICNQIAKLALKK